MSEAPSSQDFQLPLSGSREGARSGVAPEPDRTFNSLSRDHVEVEVGKKARKAVMLSTPSLGITKKRRSDGERRRLSRFQLPLSGSPSPIPGFFGSPRLSAAAPLRTNDF